MKKPVLAFLSKIMLVLIALFFFTTLKISALAPSPDVGALTVSYPSPICPIKNQTLGVKVQNYDGNDLDLSVAPIEVYIEITGASTQSFVATINSGVLLANDADVYLVTVNANFLVSGTHKINAFTKVLSPYADNDPSNDAMAEEIVVVHPEVPITFNLQSTVCRDAGPIALNMATPGGGIYRVNGVIQTSFDPLNYVVGVNNTVIYYYTDLNGCTWTSQKQIKVNANPSVTLSSFSTLCAGDEPIFLVGGTPAGGSYTVSGNPASVFNPITAGTYPVVYTYTDANSCSNTALQNILVNPLPSVSLSSFSSLCVGGNTISLSGGSPAGGSYSVNGNVATTFNPSSVGNFPVVYSYTDGNGCFNTALQNIVVNSLPSVSLLSATGYCQGGNTVVLSGGSPAGGVYRVNGNVATTFTPTTVGSYPLVYTYTDANNCSASSSSTIQVNTPPVVAFNAVPSLCTNQNAVDLNAYVSPVNPDDPTFSGTGVSTNGIFTPTVSAGTYNITYFYNDPLTQCSGTATQDVVVNAAPVVSLSSFSALCEGGNAVTLSGGLPAGGTYTLNGNSVTSFSPIASGSFSILYTYTDGNNCSNTATENIQVNALPVVSFANVPSLCEDNAALDLTNYVSPQGTGGSFSGTGSTSTGIFSAGAVAGNYPIVYTFINSTTQCSNSASYTVVVNAKPVVTLSSIDDVCINSSSFLLSGGAQAGGLYYVDYSSTPSTNFDPVVSGAHHVNYVYIDVTTQCSDSASTTFNVNALPIVSLGQDIEQCGGSVELLPTTNGVSYLWSTGATTDTTTVSATGNYIFTAYDAIGCENSDTINVMIKNLPDVSFVLPAMYDTICTIDAPIVLSGGAPVGNTTDGVYSGTGVSLSGNDYIFDPAGSNGFVTVTYTFTNSNTGCQDTATQQIFVEVCEPNSINNVFANTDFNVYPNPSDGLVYLSNKVASNDLFNITLVDMQGRTVYSETLNGLSNNSVKSFDFSSLSNGIYMLRLNNGQNELMKRVSIQK